MKTKEILETAQLLKDTVKQQVQDYGKADIAEAMSERVRGMFILGCTKMDSISADYTKLLHNCYNVGREFSDWQPKDDKDIFEPSWRP